MKLENLFTAVEMLFCVLLRVNLLDPGLHGDGYYY